MSSNPYIAVQICSTLHTITTVRLLLGFLITREEVKDTRELYVNINKRKKNSLKRRF